VTITIGGQRFIVRSEADESYVQTLAEHINHHIDEISHQTSQAQKTISHQNLLVLAALNITDDLFRERANKKELALRIKEKSKAIFSMLDKEVRRHVENALNKY